MTMAKKPAKKPAKKAVAQKTRSERNADAALHGTIDKLPGDAGKTVRTR
jgi:hypothetical protein